MFFRSSRITFFLKLVGSYVNEMERINPKKGAQVP